MSLMQVANCNRMDFFFTGYRCICSLPKKIPRISDGDFFRDRHWEPMEETWANLFSS